MPINKFIKVSCVEVLDVGAIKPKLVMNRLTPGVNPVPVMVTEVPVPAGIEEGLIELIVGTTVGTVIANGCAPEGPPPGVGFVTVT